MPDPIILNGYENELLSFPAGVTADEGNRTVRKLLVPWVFLADIKAAILGYPSIGDGGVLNRWLPWHDSDDVKQFAVRCDHRGVKTTGATTSESADTPMSTGNRYSYAEITVYFNSLPYDTGTGTSIELIADDTGTLYAISGGSVENEASRFCSVDVRPGRDWVTAKPGNFTWAGPDGRIPIPFPIPELLPYEEIDLIWHLIPAAAYPRSAISACMGKVNNDGFDLPSYPGGPLITYTAETILLQAVRRVPRYLSDSTPAYDVHFAFKRRDPNWNSLLGPDGIARRVYRGNSTDGIFATQNFSKLLKTEAQF